MNQSLDFADGPRLLADIGGTNARFALEAAPGRFEAITVLACNEYPSLAAAIAAYLARPEVAARLPATLRHAALAMATPVDGDQISLVNNAWMFSIEDLRCTLGLHTLLVVNDFTALAMAVPELTNEQRIQVGGARARADAAIGLIGAGTGLGMAGLIPEAGGWRAIASEGGHATFPPSDERELAVLRYAWTQFEHVSAERLLSGPGLELIYRALAHAQGRCNESLEAPEIVGRALSGSDRLCDQTLECFCSMLGTVAGNLALTLSALGGIYIGGGIVPRLGERFARSGFRQRFERKGRFSSFMAQIPVFVITAEFPAFLGLSALLASPARKAVAG